jgi:hypothetical protein
MPRLLRYSRTERRGRCDTDIAAFFPGRKQASSHSHIGQIRLAGCCWGSFIIMLSSRLLYHCSSHPSPRSLDEATVGLDHPGRPPFTSQCNHIPTLYAIGTITLVAPHAHSEDQAGLASQGTHLSLDLLLFLQAIHDMASCVRTRVGAMRCRFVNFSFTAFFFPGTFTRTLFFASITFFFSVPCRD